MRQNPTLRLRPMSHTGTVKRSGSFSTSVRNLVWARITIQLWGMTTNLMN